jgi:hypothetical protein
MRAVAELTEPQTAALKEAMAIYPHIGRRAFYSAVFMVGCRELNHRAGSAAGPIPLNELFDGEGNAIVGDFILSAPLALVPKRKRPPRKKAGAK